MPNLLKDIKNVVEPESQTDPTFRTTKLYSPLTAEEVYRRLIEDKNYMRDELPIINSLSDESPGVIRISKVLGLARTMMWNGVNSIVNFVKKNYEKGMTLTRKAMENMKE